MAYVPWVNADWIFEHVAGAARRACVSLDLQPFNWNRIVSGGNQNHRALWSLAYRQQDLYDSLIEEQFCGPLADANLLAVSLDWFAPLRRVVELARMHGKPTVLIPHEAAYQNEDLWYWCDYSDIKTPACDFLLLSGQQQKRIFAKRGVNPTRMQVLGSIKLDQYIGYSPQQSRKQFLDTLMLDEGRPIVLLSLQYFDSQWGDQEAALHSQREAIRDLVGICQGYGYQLLVRLPPASYPMEIIPKDMLIELRQKPGVFVDGWNASFGAHPSVAAEDAVFYSDCVLSFHSTMLLEGALIGKPCLVLQYFDFVSFWQQRYGFAVARDPREVRAWLACALDHSPPSPPSGLLKAVDDFAGGMLDGRSAERVLAALLRIAEDKRL